MGFMWVMPLFFLVHYADAAGRERAAVFHAVFDRVVKYVEALGVQVAHAIQEAHRDAQSLDMLNNKADNVMEYSDKLSPYDICSMEKSNQRNRPEKAHHDKIISPHFTALCPQHQLP